MSRTKHARSHKVHNCPSCPHARHPKGLCTVTSPGSGNHNWQCGCAFGMKVRNENTPQGPQAKGRYVPAGRF